MDSVKIFHGKILFDMEKIPQSYTLKEKPNELEIEIASIILLFTKMMICYLHIFYLAGKNTHSSYNQGAEYERKK